MGSLFGLAGRLDNVGLAFAAAAVLVLDLRRAATLTTWDSVMFALATEDYDVGALRPHAPGYPLYVLLARLLLPLHADANQALITISVASVAIAAYLLHRLGKQLAGPWTAAVATALFVVSPVVVWNGRIATSYPTDALWSVAVASLCWSMWRRPTVRATAGLAVLFAVAIGFRQSLAFFLGPLVAVTALRPVMPWRETARRLTAAVAAGGVALLAWFVPMVRLSGGLADWRTANDLQSGQVVFRHTVYNDGLAAWQDLWPRMALYLRTEIWFLLPLLLIAGWSIALARLRMPPRGMPRRVPRGGRETSLFLALWAVPASLFYLTIFNGWDRGPPGYVLVLLPALHLGAAVLLGVAWQDVARVWGNDHGRARTAATVLLILPLGGSFVLWDDPVDFDQDAHDAWAEAWSGLPATLPPDNTTILASHSWAHVWYHFPEYTSWGYTPIPEGTPGAPWGMLGETKDRQADLDWYRAIARGPDGTRHPIPAGIEHVVVFDFQLAGENGGPRALDPAVPVHEGHLDNGWRVLFFDVTPERPAIEDYFIETPDT